MRPMRMRRKPTRRRNKLAVGAFVSIDQSFPLSNN